MLSLLCIVLNRKNWKSTSQCLRTRQQRLQSFLAIWENKEVLSLLLLLKMTCQSSCLQWMVLLIMKIEITSFLFCSCENRVYQLCCVFIVFINNRYTGINWLPLIGCESNIAHSVSSRLKSRSYLCIRSMILIKWNAIPITEQYEFKTPQHQFSPGCLLSTKI